MQTRVIAITGPSGSGKTYFSEKFSCHLRDRHPEIVVEVLSEDAYYRDRPHLDLEQRASINYDHPEAIEHELLIEHLHQLRQGRDVEVPVYDYSFHQRTDSRRRLQPSSVLIVEGILLLSNTYLRDQFDLRLYIDTPLEVCLQRRVVRDTEERGRSHESVLKQFNDTVKPMFHQFIEPCIEYADLVISGENRDGEENQEQEDNWGQSLSSVGDAILNLADNPASIHKQPEQL